MTKNKVYNGNAYKLIKQVENKSVDLIYTDVPYLFDSHGKGSSKLAERMDKKNKDLIDLQDGFDYSIYDEYLRVLKKINIIIWVSNLQILDTLNYFMKHGSTTFRILTWHKTNPSPTCNNNWLPDTEYAIHFRERGVAVNDGYELKQTYHISPINKADKDKYEHPTIKPLELVRRHILHTTKEDDLVLDTFLGSGTTAVACKQLKRNYIGFELNEQYYKQAIKRIDNTNVMKYQTHKVSIFDL